MKITILSDIHLESDIYYTPWKLYSPADEHTLILAGDVIPLRYLQKNDPEDLFCSSGVNFFNRACENFRNVIYVPGNHEYYHGDINELDAWFKNFANDMGWYNLHYLNADSIELDGMRFVGATLWTEVDPISMGTTARYMADYRTILSGKNRFTAAQSVALHRKHLEYFEATIKKDDIVITHHTPSHQSIAPQFKGNGLNPFFYNDLDEFILTKKPRIWVHGHTHASMDYMIGKTRIICNPKGYFNPYRYSSPENPEFDERLLITL